MRLSWRGLVVGGGAASLLSMAGCGFQPVYMPTASGAPGPGSRELAAIHVAIIPDRPGQLLRQDLQQRFRGAGDDDTPLYDLSVVFWIAGQGIGVLQNNDVTRVKLIASANWSLVGRDPGRTPITQGFARAIDGVDNLDQQTFGVDLGTEQATTRLADAIADQIALRLAVFFRQKAGLHAGP
jgi:LPS-assembly lipoprotein